MIKKISEKYNISEMLVKGILIVLILIFMILFIIFSGNGSRKNNKKYPLTHEDLNKLLDMIGDNYTLDIDETINGKMNNIIYSRDSKLELYESNNKAYMYYKNKLYEINQDNYKIKNVDNLSFVDNPFYNINLLKNVFKHCKLEYVNNVKSICNIKSNDYLNEYNLMYNTTFSGNDDIIKFNLVYYNTGIGKINVDYSNINRIINNNYDSVKYGIRIDDLNKNNFDDFINYYKDTLNK